MRVEARVTIQASRSDIWDVISAIETSAEAMGGIEKVEVVHRPPSGLVGLRWRETRMLFGEPATVEKWITEAVENESYRTRAEDGGFVFLTTLRIDDAQNGMLLTSIHETRPAGLAARLKALPMFLFRGTIRKAILRDLDDLRMLAERA